MTTAEIILATLAVLWVAGWLATVWESGGLDRGQPGQRYRLLAIVVQFFCWPVLAMIMATNRH